MTSERTWETSGATYSIGSHEDREGVLCLLVQNVQIPNANRDQDVVLIIERGQLVDGLLADEAVIDAKNVVEDRVIRNLRKVARIPRPYVDRTLLCYQLLSWQKPCVFAFQEVLFWVEALFDDRDEVRPGQHLRLELEQPPESFNLLVAIPGGVCVVDGANF